MLQLLPVLAAAAVASSPGPAAPLVLAAPQPSTPASAALDVAVPLAASALMLGLLGASGDASLYTYGLMGGTLALPPAALVAYHDRAFRLDDYFAATSGGTLGLLLGLGLSFALWRGPGQGLALAPGQTATAQADPQALYRLAFMAVGQGLGAASGRLVYERVKPQLLDLNQLPTGRADDQLDWDSWKKRHHNE